MKKEIYTPNEVAKICNISHKTVANYCDSGKIINQQSPITKHRKILRKDLITFMESYGISLEALEGDKVYDLMIIDNNPDDLEALERLLRKQDNIKYNVSSFMDGVSALIQLGQKKPDLIFLDMRMPDLDGLDVCKKIKENSKLNDLKIVVLTESDDPTYKEKAELFKVDYFLKKPMTKESLEEVFKIFK